MFWSVLVAALIFFVLPIHVDVWLWFGLRFTLGIGQSFLWIARQETWISHLVRTPSPLANYSPSMVW